MFVDNNGGKGPPKRDDDPDPEVVLKLCGQIVQLAQMCGMSMVISTTVPIGTDSSGMSIGTIGLGFVRNSGNLVALTRIFIERARDIAEMQEIPEVIDILKQVHTTFYAKLSEHGITFDVAPRSDEAAGE